MQKDFEPGPNCPNCALCSGLKNCWRAALLANDLHSAERGLDTGLSEKEAVCNHPQEEQALRDIAQFLNS